MIDRFTEIINLYDHLNSQVSVGPGGPLHIRNQVGTPDNPPPELKHDDNCALTRV